MPANPVLMPPTALDTRLGWHPWLRDLALAHIAAHPELAEGRHGHDRRAATSGFPKVRLREGLVEMARSTLRGQGFAEGTLSDEHVLGFAPPGWVVEMNDLLEREYTVILNHILSGEKAFLFSPNLSERLVDTEMNVPIELFALPFRSCMFVYDSDVARQALHAIGGASPPGKGPVTVFLTLMGGTPGEETLAMVASHTDGPRAYASFIRSLRLDTAATVEEALRTVHKADPDRPPSHDALGDEAFFGPGLRFYRMVMNSVLYLSSADPDVSSEGLNRLPDELLALAPKKRRYAEHLLKKASTARFVHVGEKMPRLPPVPTDRTGRKIDARFKVRAHWRSQAYGEGRQLRKTILIEEHWKGPDAAEIVSRPYLVE